MSGARQRLNKMVRQMPGGSTVLDSCELFDQMSLRHHPATETGQIVKVALDRFNDIANQMRDAALAESKRP